MSKYRLLTVPVGGGTNTSDATAQPDDILSGKTAYNADGKIEGTILTVGNDDITVERLNVTIPSGYIAEQMTVEAQPNLKAETVTPTRTQMTINTPSGYDGLSSVTVQGYTPNNTNVEVTPTTAEQSVSTPEGYDGISNVTVAAVTAEIDANITADNIKKDVEILGVTGTLEGDDFLEKFASKTLTNISCTTQLDNLIQFKNQTYLTTADFVFREPTVDFCYNFMFQGCRALTTAPALPATTLKPSCYYNMFEGCTSLTTAPSLPATTLAYSCYNFMFNGCTSLTTAPALPATTLADSCYQGMFYDCTSLVNAPALPATTLQRYCYSYMFNGCTSLVNAPALPATTLQPNCYSYMFNGCRALTTAPALPATTLTEYCYLSMFRGCKSLQKTGEIAASGSISSNVSSMFYGCTSLRETTWTATTPPTISSNIWTNCPSDMVIYVPDESVDAYKAASVWSSRAAYIKGISEKPTA